MFYARQLVAQNAVANSATKLVTAYLIVQSRLIFWVSIVWSNPDNLVNWAIPIIWRRLLTLPVVTKLRLSSSEQRIDQSGVPIWCINLACYTCITGQVELQFCLNLYRYHQLIKFGLNTYTKKNGEGDFVLENFWMVAMVRKVFYREEVCNFASTLTSQLMWRQCSHGQDFNLVWVSCPPNPLRSFPTHTHKIASSTNN